MGVFTNIVAWATFIFVQFYMPRAKDVKWYSQSRISGAPPSWLFGVVWTVLYAILTAVAVTFFQDDTFVAIFVLFVANIILNKLWTPVFFRARMTGLGIVIIVLMILSEIAILILFGLEAAWLQFGLYVPYCLWTAYALFLNIQMYQARPPRRSYVTPLN